MKSFVIAAIFACVIGYICCGYSDAPYQKLQYGKKSGSNDDSESYSVCGNYYHMINCTCSPRKNCDGAWLASGEDGPYCKAFNKAGMSGVVSKAACIRAVVNMASETTTDPEVSCPPNYIILGCQLHSYFQHKHPTCRALRSDSKCQVTGCPAGSCTDCRVQARCVRISEYFYV